MHPTLYIVPTEEWLAAAHQIGWKQVETRQISLPCVCPQCIDEIDDLEKQNDAFLAERAKNKGQVA